jgi:hypothetical protein
LPELGLIAGTRALAGAGLGLLLANRLSSENRRAIGWTLLLVGAVSTIPLALEVLDRRRQSAREETEHHPSVEFSEQQREESALTGI